MKYIRNKFLRTLVNFPRNLAHTIESCYLCARFPFLYPRNRFSGLHYTNWKLEDYICKIKKLGCKTEFVVDGDAIRTNVEVLNR